MAGGPGPIPTLLLTTTRAWDRAYLPALLSGDFANAGGDVLWVVAAHALTVGG